MSNQKHINFKLKDFLRDDTIANVIFNVEYKIYGTEETGRMTLQKSGYNPSTINYIISTSINKNNYNVEPYLNRLKVITDIVRLMINITSRISEFDHKQFLGLVSNMIIITAIIKRFLQLKILRLNILTHLENMGYFLISMTILL